jgi:hypothetical protein
VRFEHSYIKDGVPVTEWRTTVYTGTLPRTRRELELSIEQDAQGLADDYGVEHVGVGDYYVMSF